MVEFLVHTNYSQLCVFNRQMDRPLNAWTEQHISQGFSWREGSVSFKTLEEELDLVVKLEIVQDLPQIHTDSVQVIDVPLKVSSGGIEIGSTFATEVVKIPNGLYKLRMEMLRNSKNVNLWFSADSQNSFKVHKLYRNAEIPNSLVKTAQPA
jgi:Competence protein J (ComJ)